MNHNKYPETHFTVNDEGDIQPVYDGINGPVFEGLTPAGYTSLPRARERFEQLRGADPEIDGYVLPAPKSDEAITPRAVAAAHRVLTAVVLQPEQVSDEPTIRRDEKGYDFVDPSSLQRSIDAGLGTDIPIRRERRTDKRRRL